MSNVISAYKEIDLSRWNLLVQSSSTATWFQSADAYNFFASMPDLFEPFVLAIENESCIKGIVAGYITIEKNRVKQFFTRRAIIIGGPAFSNDITDDELSLLLLSLKNYLRGKAIYIETRNFNDYSKWRNVFESCGFSYEHHLNFHVDTSALDVVNSNLGKSRKRDIRTSLRDGAVVIENPNIEQVKSYYSILENLYKHKVKTPLFPFSFFENLYNQQYGKFLLVEYDGKIVGGTVCVEEQNKCLYEWFVCGEDGVYRTIFPSSVATYAGMKYAAEHNCSRFDMMGAGSPSVAYGVRDFKAKFGGKLIEYGRYKLVRSNFLYYIGLIGVKLYKLVIW